MLVVFNSADQENLVEHDFCAAISILDEFYQDKTRKYLNKSDRIQCLVGQLLVHKFVKEFSQNDKTVERESNGRPFIKTFEGDFNLSHHGKYVGIGVCAKGRIGIDLIEIGGQPIEMFIRYFHQEK